MAIPSGPTLYVYSGDSFSQSFTFTSADGTPKVLTGSWSASFRPDPAANVSVPFTVDTSQMATGQITLSMASTVTPTLNANVGRYDLQQIDGGLTKTWVSGSVVWVTDVTR